MRNSASIAQGRPALRPAKVPGTTIGGAAFLMPAARFGGAAADLAALVKKVEPQVGQ